MKGLVYSFNIRVAVLNDTFGGLRGRIGYEVDSSHLKHGDKIEGSFFIVTNGGEQEIPYCFQVENSASGRTLDDLRTSSDFGDIAGTDMEQALLLFEYQDFIRAPFMQDMHVRTLYEGIRGSGNRADQLEEFLIALKLKEPVALSADTSLRSYHNLSGPMEDQIVIHRQTWGFTLAELQSDGDFIELEKKTLTNSDFTDNTCTVTYRLRPELLHHGRNSGAVMIKTIRGSVTIPVEMIKERGRSEGKETENRPDLSAYIELRLDYESALYEDRLMLGQMAGELERQGRKDPKNTITVLLLAETCICQGDKERAVHLLDDVRGRVLDGRQEDVVQYCFYQYLLYLFQRNEGQREALTRLLRKYLSEPGRHDFLFLMMLRVEPGLAENPGDLLARMRNLHREGSFSPFLYMEAWKLYQRDPLLLKKMDSFELQVLIFAARRDMVEKPMALKIAVLAVAVKYYHRLLFRLLEMLYQRYQEKQILEAVCSMLIKGDVRSREEFHWFEKALRAGVNLTRLYEYFLYCLPADYNRLLPKEVLMYFSYAKDLDRHSRSILYMNIIKYMKPEAALYRRYERDMEQFAMEQLFESRINSRLAVLYEHVIYKDIIDVPVAKVLPSILRSFKVSCSNPAMKYAVVCYEELTGEDVYPLDEGTAYIPLFFDHHILMFQDAYGNRYTDIPYEKAAVMKSDISGLEKRCFDVYPGHPMLRLKECRAILDSGLSEGAELFTLEGILGSLPLRPLFRQHLVSAMIDFLLRDAERQEDTGRIENSVLWGLIPDDISEKEQGSMIEILILQGRSKEAYDMIRQYGCEHVRDSRLMKLCAKMILQHLFDQDETLLALSFGVFTKGRYDTVILDYLCEHFNGTSGQMYDILTRGIADRVETYDLEERLLAQMLFSGAVSHLDQVFSLYAARKKTRENIIRAYFTVKSKAYFIDGAQVGSEVFTYLEQAVLGSPDRGWIPALYHLALTRYYAELPELTEEQKRLCKIMVDLLLDEEMVFPYFKKLGRHISVPEELLTSVMVEYHTSGNGQPDMELRIVPQEEQFHQEEMSKVFAGIFVKYMRLFEGEIMEYRIYEHEGEERIKKCDGRICADQSGGLTSDRRFLMLNEMCVRLKERDEGALRQTMDDYIICAESAERLFELM